GPRRARGVAAGGPVVDDVPEDRLRLRPVAAHAVPDPRPDTGLGLDATARSTGARAVALLPRLLERLLQTAAERFGGLAGQGDAANDAGVLGVVGLAVHQPAQHGGGGGGEPLLVAGLAVLVEPEGAQPQRVQHL